MIAENRRLHTLTLAAKRLESKITFDENALVLALQDRNADAGR
jgi:hypothetical protein